MNRARLKSYAPEARKDFLRAVTDRARKVGLTPVRTEPVEERGDVAVIGGQAFPKRVADQRRRLDEQVKRDGFTAVMEEAAYTWFNRLMAIRYMELHGYLKHGYRVLSDPSGRDRPQILEQAENVTLLGVDKGAVIDLKLDGTKDEELYKLLLLGQCHALHLTMPFLFERIDDQTELLLPDNLLASDSVIRKMVTEIAEADWEQIEVIGWLYQFYISEKKDALMSAKKAYASADIPAVTQLFTPNWIVKYMVQNSLGRQWLATYPQSPLRAQMEYYIEPAEQTEDVQAQIAAITPKAIDPETVTLIDPACGSGHILVEAYAVFKEIYLERGYRLRDIPRLILEKNLFGLEIDDRAAQMAGFALLMKARADDPRILDRVPTLNVRAIQSSSGLDAASLASALLAPKRVELVPNRELFPELNAQPALVAEHRSPLRAENIADLCALFADAKTFGSLLTVPDSVATVLPVLREFIGTRRSNEDLLASQAVDDLEPLVDQAEFLARKYDCTVANPPYMGNKFLNSALKTFVQKNYAGFDKDVFSAFIIRNINFTKPNGHLGFMSPFVWMFISSYENLRRKIIEDAFLSTLIQLEYSGFEGATVPICTFTLQNRHLLNGSGTYVKLSEFKGAENQSPRALEAIKNPRCGWLYNARPDKFEVIPGSPIAYWVSSALHKVFATMPALEDIAPSRVGLQTGDNSRFLRFWWEVNASQIGVGITSRSDASRSNNTWFPYNKGGEFRKWYGNNDCVVNWKDDGDEVRRCTDERGKIRSRPQNTDFFFKDAITWTKISSAYFGVRYCGKGFIFDVAGSSSFPKLGWSQAVTSFLISKVTFYFLQAMNPTLNFQVGNVAALPFAPEVIGKVKNDVDKLAADALQIAKRDWDSEEKSWDFTRIVLIENGDSLAQSYLNWKLYNETQRATMRKLEEENNRVFINAYGLSDELTPDVPDDQITLALAERDYDLCRLISYALGCMMGRYSLDELGLIYAHSANEGFDPSRYTTFPADSDGILPLTDTDWFGAEDTANRFGDFLKTAWPAETYHENVQFVADSLSPKAVEAPMDTIRRYLATGFYKNHLQTYKKRPIYWLFSSGKERAFQALVYLHRYNEGTLARMRMEYVAPLQSRLSARLDQLNKDPTVSTSTPDRKKREGEKAKLTRQYLELLAFDEKLRHYADQRIRLDLDDGVKVNYSKFGDLLSEVKTITGDKDE